ncbi:DUF2207 domain-containing protein [Rhizobium metallidurans]|uniref:Putative membrane protein YgcG n=1 Tax=Rhizobium metallidurans TaxID=1265931 RepID=A0A7W6CSS2_9HYPH|nr:DUF2207 domain-containing protein [Rhizobium metallidurans]MBB3966463.1 putative membrane protein YgcG [Rhizobium metallidurans]
MRWLSGLVAAFMLLVAASLAAANERITSYHSEVQVAKNGDLTVTETISIVAEGIRVKRGIFRDFPLTMLDGEGRTVRVGFDLLSVTRDGQPEPYKTESIDGGIRIYAGSSDAIVPEGERTYVLTYKVDRMIRYFPDHDEVYWNVTGTGWQFAIEQASARITMPSGEVTRLAVYTGRFGSRASNATSRIEGNQAIFATNRILGPSEGLTVVAGVPKGVIDPPSARQLRAWWLRDNMAEVIAVAGLLLVLVYYVFFWMRVGRDPARGVVVPRWDPPEGLSPALVNYIDNKGFNGAGWPAFSANALDLAVKGYVTFGDIGSSISVTRTDKPAPKALPAGQAAFLSLVGRAGQSFSISKSNGEKVRDAGQKFRQAIESEHRGKYYHANTLYTVGGIVLSVLFIGAVLAFGEINADLSGFIAVTVFSAVFLGILSARLGLSFRKGAPLRSKIAGVIIGGFFGFTLLSILAGIVTSAVEQLTAADHWPVIVAIGGIVMTNVVFFFLMGAPTSLGSRLMDHIDGLRRYLTVAEKDRMNMAGAPAMSPQHFETLLPYAVALGVEKPWSDAFQTWLATAAAAGAAAVAYSPIWYPTHSGSFGDSIGGFSSSMASTIASTLPAPVTSTSSGFSGGGGGFSSGGGGGGFSGGGGGGGGGGGW